MSVATEQSNSSKKILSSAVLRLMQNLLKENVINSKMQKNVMCARRITLSFPMKENSVIIILTVYFFFLIISIIIEVVSATEIIIIILLCYLKSCHKIYQNGYLIGYIRYYLKVYQQYS